MTGIATAYAALKARGELRADAWQAAAVAELQGLQDALAAEAGRGWFARLRRADPIPGIYMWGGVGRGKSMLMDLFAATLPDGITAKRAHLHAFMQDVHARLRAAHAAGAGDPIPPVADAIADEAKVFCFDEMVVNNIADAMIMSRLFTALIDAGMVIVTTSNRPPGDLYKDGLNREHFLPFIDLVTARMRVLALDGPVDYRLARLDGIDLWHTPLGDAATARAREAFFRLTDYPPEDAANVPSATLDVGGGRTLHVPKSLKGVAVFSFKRLCVDPRGAPDYLAIARAYHTVVIVGIPQLGPERRNEAARFVTLIDTLYEHRVKLVVTAAVEPEALYPAGDGRFEFDRTVSRLNEMQSGAYLARGHGTG